MVQGLPGKYVKVLLSIVLACSILLLSVSSFPQSASAATTYLYASPTGSGSTCSIDSPCSLIGAQTQVRAMNAGMTGDIVVYLRDGSYTLSSTFQLTEADSGSNGFKVIYQNYPGEVPIISGGTQINGWTLHDSSNNIWQASVSSSLRFRQLYVSDSRAIRARTPNRTNETTRGPYYSATGGMSASAPYTFTVNASELANWDNLNQVEVVMIDHWKQKNARISSYTGGTISFLSPENSEAVMYHSNQPGTPHYYENAYEFIDAEGEWYLNTTTNILYYKPRAGEDMSAATVIAPNLDNLVTVTGANNTTDMAHDIQITGITFQYSNWTLPSSIGYLNYQGGVKYGSSQWPLGTYYPGAIQLQNSRNITIDYNTIRHTGAHAILALDDTKDSIFDHNTITDTSDGGIYLGLRTSNSSGNRVTYNTITYGGMEYTDALGIFLEFAPNAVVNHNEVAYYRYTGINAGLDWSDKDTAATNIEISYNSIHDVMLLHDDGGGIYTLGKIPNMNIHDNYVYSLSGSSYNGGFPIAGIYLDNGSTGKTVQNNVIDSVPNTFFANNPPNYGNTFQYNYYNSPLGNIAGANTVQNNISVSGSNWPTVISGIDCDPLAGTGDSITIHGNRLGSVKGKITFSGKNGPVIADSANSDLISWTDREIIVKIPVNAVSGTVYITTSDGTDSNKDQTINFVGKPNVVLFHDDFDSYPVGALPKDNYTIVPNGFEVTDTDSTSGSKALRVVGGSGGVYKQAAWKNSLLSFNFNIKDPANIVQAVSMTAHAVAFLTADGYVHVNGSNEKGGYGNNAVTPSYGSKFVMVTTDGAVPLSGIDRLYATQGSVIYAWDKDTHKLYSWGDNGFLRAGVSHNMDPIIPVAKEVDFLGAPIHFAGDKPQSLSVNYGTVFLIDQDGKVWSWGQASTASKNPASRTFDFRLGREAAIDANVDPTDTVNDSNGNGIISITDAYVSEVPGIVPFTDDPDEKAMAVGGGNFKTSYILTDKGNVYVFGGTSISPPDRRFKKVTDPVPGRKFVKMSVSPGGACLLLDDAGQVYQMNATNTIDAQTVPTLAMGIYGDGGTNPGDPEAAAKTFTKVTVSGALNNATFFAATDQGEEYVWGSNNKGIAAMGTTSGSFPAAVLNTNLQNVDDFTAVQDIGVMLKSGKLYTWGNNNGGQLANGTPVDAASGTPAEVLSENLTSFQGIYASSYSDQPSGAENKYYFSVTPAISGNTLMIQKYVNGSYTNVAAKSKKIDTGVWYTYKTLILNDVMYAKVWPAQEAEPANWDLSGKLGGLSSGGGLNFEFYSSSPNTALFDDIAVQGWDNEPPVTTALVEGTQQNGWFNTDAKVTLDAKDELSGVKQTEYKVTVTQATSQTNQPSTNGYVLYSSPIVLDEGVYQLDYRSTDTAGNVEDNKTIHIKVDKTGPAILTPENLTLMQTEALQLNVDVSDELSGVTTTALTMDGEPVSNPVTADASALSLGDHVIQVTAADASGNTSDKTFVLAVMMDADHLDELINQGAANGWVTGDGILNSLLSKVEHIQKDVGKDVNGLNALEQEVKAQAGREISSEFAALLLQDIAYLKNKYENTDN